MPSGKCWKRVTLHVSNGSSGKTNGEYRTNGNVFNAFVQQ